MGKQIRTYLPGIVLLLFAIVIGLYCYKDYGVGWDEPLQRDMGVVSFNYIFNGDTTLYHYPDRDHGTGFELPLYLAEKAFHITDSRDVYLMRHLVSYLFFVFSMFAGYVLALKLFKKQWLACLGFVLMVFHPRIFAHAFFNTKDIPFLAAAVLVAAAAYFVFEHGKRSRFLLLGVLCGYATSVRLLGVVFVAITVFFLLADIFYSGKKEERKRILINGFFFVAAFFVAVYIAWPTLWRNPVAAFADAFRSLAHFRWEGQVFFNGNFYDHTTLPRTYIPVWMAITIPVLWLVTGMAGMLIFILKFLSVPTMYLRNGIDRNLLFLFAAMTVPLLSVIVLHSFVYDDWRHLYFIYPFFVFFVLYALSLLQKPILKYAVMLLFILQCISTGIFIVQNHPNEYVYFNRLVPHKNEYIRRHYDMDYWGISYRQALDYIDAHDNRPVKKLAWYGPMLENSQLIMPAGQRGHFVTADDMADADYLVTVFRYHPDDYEYRQVFYDIRVLDNTILRVYKLK